MQPTLIPSRIAAEVEYFTERAQAMADQRADAEYERRERIERFVSFDDLLEELTALDGDRKRVFMDSLAAEESDFVVAVLHNAKERIIKRRLARGE